MGGSIQVRSIPKQGSQFEFTVILQPSQQPQPPFPLPEIATSTLLVVDDNAANRDVLCGQLQAWGATVLSAADGPSALALCQAHSQSHNGSSSFPFDLALVDMQMPGMGGIQLGRCLKANERFREMPLVMMTTLGDSDDVQELTELGFSAHFSKPLTPSNLLEALTKVSRAKVRQSNILPGELEAISWSDKTNYPGITASLHWPETIRLLLVEDHKVNQMVVKGLLKNLGLSVDLTSNGREALRALKQASPQNPYTAVFMDCLMPEMDGYEATRRIREGEAGECNRDVIIIAMTANAMKGDQEQCLSAGMDDYLSKPISPKGLTEMLEKWLSVSKDS